MSDTGALVIEVPDVPPTATLDPETEVASSAAPSTEDAQVGPGTSDDKA